MHVPVLLAHGALGAFDEIIFISVALLFVVVMGISWMHSRNNPPDDADETEANTDSAPPLPADSAPDHFKLD